MHLMPDQPSAHFATVAADRNHERLSGRRPPSGVASLLFQSLPARSQSWPVAFSLSFVKQVHFILYVGNQSASRIFYERLLKQEPRLDVPGMTEFELGPNTILGLMPEAGIESLLPIKTSPITPRCELYLVFADLTASLQRALDAGARLLSPPEVRSWGARVAYLLDPDQNVIALADDRLP